MNFLCRAGQTLPRRFQHQIFNMTSVTNRDTCSAAEPKITADSKCVACKGIGEAMKPEEVEMQRALLIPNWTATDNFTRLRRSLRTKNFSTALDYINRIGQIAEAEQHHPDIAIHSYNHVDIVLWTHTLGGITENDLIMAVKIDTLPVQLSKKKAANTS